ncbi:hypothetical protein B0H13DRAFT_2378146 [Mycena leptocephala]|nr:hypothetical protein B0H13DRAFT_2378146 [Mycena leptocephala]
MSRLHWTRVLICAMMLACAFGMVQMIHQVFFTAMFVQLLRSAGTVEAIGTLQHIQVAFLHLAQVQGTWDDILLLLNNFAADMLFIYRCYVIWSGSRYKRQVIGVPLIFLLLDYHLHFPGSTPVIVVSVGLAITNLLLTGLTAGRIWWTRRHLQVIGEPKLVHRYMTAIKLLFESSLLYFVIFLVYLLIDILGSPATFESPVIALLFPH